MVKEVVPQIVVRRLKVRHRRLAAVLEGLRQFGFRGPATGGTPALCGCGPASSRGSSDLFLSDVLLELLCCRDQFKILDLVPFTAQLPPRRSPHPPPAWFRTSWRRCLRHLLPPSRLESVSSINPHFVLALGGIVLGLQPTVQLLYRPLVGPWRIIVIGPIQL